LNKTQAVVATLITRLPSGPFHVFVDNLFSGSDLFTVLRNKGHGATGTVRTNAGIFEDIVKLKALDRKGKTDWVWGQHQEWPTPNNKARRTVLLVNALLTYPKVNQIAWKDSALVLFLSTIYTGQEVSVRRRKRPTSTSPWAGPIKRHFGDKHVMELELLSVAADYNDLMNAVDISDQYRAETVSDHRERRGAARALAWSFHLSVAVANSFLLQKLGKPQWPKVLTQLKWLEIIVNEIFEQYGKTGTSRTRYRAGDERTPFELHEQVYEGHAACRACKGERIGYQSQSQAFQRRRLKQQHRFALAGLSDDALNVQGQSSSKGRNQRRTRKRRTTQTRWRCKTCNVALCNTKKCWYFWHREDLPLE
jgi:hypothetical protein